MPLTDRTIRAADPMPTGRDVKNEQQISKPMMASEPHFQQLIGLLRRRTRLILTIAAFGTILAGVTGLLIAPKYTAKAQIVVEPQAKTSLSPEAVQQAIDTHVTMLTSADHLQHVVESLRNKPESGGAVSETRTEAEASARGLDGDAQSQSGAVLQTPTKPITTEAEPLSFKELERRLNVWLQALTRKRGDARELTFDDLDRRLKVMQERRSRVITIYFQWTSPEGAAAIANQVAQLYVSSLSEQQQNYSIVEMVRLGERIAALSSDVERTGAAMHKAIERRFDARQSSGSEQQEAEAQWRELERHATTSAQLYANLSQRQKEIREQQDLIKPDANILSLATPPARPSSPNPILFMVPALIASSICGSLLAVVLERLDRGLRCDGEIKDALGISCVGLVPRIPRRHPTHLGEYALAEPCSSYAAAIRSAIAMLRLAEPGHATKVVLISSSIPGEGKTTLARSLAALVGALGRRVLLLDLNLQQGSLPRELYDTSERGNVDLFLQHRPPVERIRHIAEAGFDYLPMLGHRRNRRTLLASEQMPGLIRQLRERYDCVIIDGPPVLGAVEARLLPSIADQLLFVVKWGSTRRDAAQNAMSLLRDSGDLNKDRSDLAVAIVTQVDLKRHARYRYGDVGEFLVEDRNSFEPPAKTTDTEPQQEPMKAASLYLPRSSTGSFPSRD